MDTRTLLPRHYASAFRVNLRNITALGQRCLAAKFPVCAAGITACYKHGGVEFELHDSGIIMDRHTAAHVLTAYQNIGAVAVC